MSSSAPIQPRVRCVMCTMSFKDSEIIRVCPDVTLCSQCKNDIYATAAAPRMKCTECAAEVPPLAQKDEPVVYTLHQRLYNGKAKRFNYCMQCTIDELSTGAADHTAAMRKAVNHITGLALPRLELDKPAVEVPPAPISSVHTFPTHWWDEQDYGSLFVRDTEYNTP